MSSCFHSLGFVGHEGPIMALGMTVVHWTVPSSLIITFTAISLASSSLGVRFCTRLSPSIASSLSLASALASPPMLKKNAHKLACLVGCFIVRVTMAMGSENPAPTTASLISSLVTLPGATPHTPVAETVLMH